MAKKTNCVVNGKKMYRLRTKLADGTTKSFYGSSKKEAEKKRDEYLAVGNATGTFKEYFIKWALAVKKPSVANSTFNQIENKWHSHIKKAKFVNKRITDITSMDIQLFINERPSVSIAKKCKVIIKDFLNYCTKERLISYNPANNITLPKDSAARTKKKHLTLADVDIIKNNLDKVDFIFIFALMTGLRQGEILALTHEDVDFKNMTINVNKSLSRERDADRHTVMVVKATKNKSSIRKAPIPTAIVKPLKKHINAEREKWLKFGVPFDSSNPLFTSPILKFVRRDKLTAKWRKIQTELGIESVNFHGLRHTFCTLLALNDVDLKTASTLMGHSNISTTAAVYTHINEQRKKDAIKKLDNVL